MRAISTFFLSLIFLSVNVMANEPPLNDMLSAYAKAFAGKTKAPFQLPHPELLDTSKLDGSVSSLKTVDNYLNGLTKTELSHKNISMVSMLAGAYIGDVIVKTSKQGHQWVLFTEYAKSHTGVKRSEPGSVYTEYLLANKAGDISMPINNVAHFLDSSKTFSALEYASTLLK